MLGKSDSYFRSTSLDTAALKEELLHHVASCPDDVGILLQAVRRLDDILLDFSYLNGLF